MTVEGIRNTENVKILDKKPEYGWVLNEDVVTQTAYQILVASSLTNINSHIGDVWNSEWVNSNHSINVEHSGNVLKNGQTYFWKVRISDQRGNPSVYSKVQSFKVSDSDTFISSRNSFQTDTIQPVVLEQREGFTFVDFGKAAFATIVFDYDAESDHELTIRIGEKLKGNTIERKLPKKSSIRYQELKVPIKAGKHSYQLDIIPDKRNTLPGTALPLPKGFPVLMPFRYAEVEGVQGSLKKPILSNWHITAIGKRMLVHL